MVQEHEPPRDGDAERTARTLLHEWMQTRPSGAYQSSIMSTEATRLVEMIAAAVDSRDAATFVQGRREALTEMMQWHEDRYTGFVRKADTNTLLGAHVAAHYEAIQHLKQALTRLDNAPVRDGWMPIDSAPAKTKYPVKPEQFLIGIQGDFGWVWRIADSFHRNLTISNYGIASHWHRLAPPPTPREGDDDE
jgi:hypothetical protein